MQFLRPWHYMIEGSKVQQAFDIREEEKVLMQKWKNATDEMYIQPKKHYLIFKIILGYIFSAIEN